ncbi:MGMT family protein [Candidatus Bathyarchaeota archaeon]|nr:MAG: MGMT family protein [Candidatus Bathyarchaeota archaeon]
MVMKKKDVKEIVERLNGLTDFERRVLIATFEIPRGKVSTYKRIAERVGCPRAYRAVGNALRKNPIPHIVPCHRVIRSDGGLGGPPERAEKRRRLLEREGIKFTGGKVKLTDDILY